MPPNFRACDVTFGMRSTTGSITFATKSRRRIEPRLKRPSPEVAAPTAAEYKDAARDNAHFFGWEWVGEKQRAVLQDDAEQFRGALSQIDEYRMMAGFGPRKAL